MIHLRFVEGTNWVIFFFFKNSHLGGIEKSWAEEGLRPEVLVVHKIKGLNVSPKKSYKEKESPSVPPLNHRFSGSAVLAP